MNLELNHFTKSNLTIFNYKLQLISHMKYVVESKKETINSVFATILKLFLELWSTVSVIRKLNGQI